LFILFACHTVPQGQNQSGKNLCKYSRLLHLEQDPSGVFSIRIQNPDDLKAADFELKIEQAYERIALLSSTHVGMMAALGQQARVCAIPDARFLADARLQKATLAGNVADLKSEQQLSVQKLLGKHTQALIYSGFGPEQAQMKRLGAIGITCIPNYEWRETHPLARAEWVLLFGILTGQFEKAKQYFKQVETNYKQILKQEKLCNAPPQLISGYIYGDQWIAPAANSFEAKLYADAQFSYYFHQNPGTGSCFSSIQSVLTKSTAVAIWLNPGQATKAALLKQFPKYAHFPFFRKRIYCYTHRTNYYWEQAAVHPDWVLSDLTNIRDHQTNKMYFYKEIH
jgi:iron complex transport system substrate-binding protein